VIGRLLSIFIDQRVQFRISPLLRVGADSHDVFTDTHFVHGLWL
jgi:hypothetical protein